MSGNDVKIRASFRVDHEEWEEFKATSRSAGMDASALLRLFIKKFNHTQDMSFFLTGGWPGLEEKTEENKGSESNN